MVAHNSALTKRSASSSIRKATVFLRQILFISLTNTPIRSAPVFITLEAISKMLRAPICCVLAPLPVLKYTNTFRSGSHSSLHLGLLAIFEMASSHSPIISVTSTLAYRPCHPGSALEQSHPIACADEDTL